MTEKALINFEKYHGRSPDFFQMSRYANQHHQNTYDPPEKVSMERPGQLVGIDHAYSDFNEYGDYDGGTEAGKKVEKLKMI